MQILECIKTILKEYSNKEIGYELANCVSFSPHHFCRTFKQITRKTTTDYINTVRLDKATRYLKQGNLNITEIAMKCGFDDINYFSRLFRKHYDITPTKCRKLYSKPFLKAF
ncbi:helix-turn-helix domain-containing protein [Clostridium sp. 19966]|uniref:helix-turn-helix domain-containing protein n=1 Tax=Clostridium sp. 19966 TaxID=2768166 RepID=UPI0037C0F107